MPRKPSFEPTPPGTPPPEKTPDSSPPGISPTEDKTIRASSEALAHPPSLCQSPPLRVENLTPSPLAPDETQLLDTLMQLEAPLQSLRTSLDELSNPSPLRAAGGKKSLLRDREKLTAILQTDCEDPVFQPIRDLLKPVENQLSSLITMADEQDISVVEKMPLYIGV